MTKALFFDIDGTLVSFETHRIPPSTIEALRQPTQKGSRYLSLPDARKPLSTTFPNCKTDISLMDI